MACRAFFCDQSPDCEDLVCPGHPVVLRRVPNYHAQEGGKAVQGGFAVSIAARLHDPEPAPLQPAPVPTPEQAEGWAARAWQWFLVAVTLVCLAAVAVAYFNS